MFPRKYTYGIVGSTGAVASTSTPQLRGTLYAIGTERPASGAISSSRLIVIGLNSSGSLIVDFINNASTAQRMIYPRVQTHRSTNATAWPSSDGVAGVPVPLFNDRLSISVDACSSGSYVNQNFHLYIDGPGAD